MRKTKEAIERGKRIKELRMSAKLSQDKFGKRIGVSRDVINNIENARVEIGEPMLRAICSEFGANLSYIRDGIINHHSDTKVLYDFAQYYNLSPSELVALDTLIKLSPNRNTLIDDFCALFGLTHMEIQAFDTFIKLPFERRAKLFNYLKGMIDLEYKEYVESKFKG